MVFCFGLDGHDSFLRPQTFSPEEQASLKIRVFNGTYDRSVHALDARGVASIVLAGPDETTHLNARDCGWVKNPTGSKLWRILQRSQSYLGGVDDRKTSSMSINLPSQGAYCLGVTLHEARIAMTPATFHAYMEEAGLEDSEIVQVLTGDPNQIIKERYTKTLKTLLHVGDSGKGDPTTPLGQVAEIVPLTDPLKVRPGDRLGFEVRLEGKPVPGQVVLSGHRQSLFNRGANDRNRHLTNNEGKFWLNVDEAGEWWLKFNHITEAGAGDEMDLVTYWSTLSFTIK